MIYLWGIPGSYKNRDVGEYDKDNSPDHYWLRKGHFLVEFSPIPIVHFEVPKKNILKFDCLPNNSLIPLVNRKIRDILEDLAPDDVQFFPAKLMCSDGELEGYSFLNSTNLITGIDHEKSITLKMDDYDGTQYIVGFHYLTYLTECMGECQLARDQEYRGNLLVNEKIKIAFDKEKIKGVHLVRPEEHYHPMTKEDLINDSLSNDMK